MKARRIALAVAFATMLATPLAAEAQQAGKTARVGFLSLRSEPTARDEPFRERMRELGHVEGHNLVTQFRWAAGKNDELPRLAEELVKLNVDVIVATGTPPSHAARRATRTIPIVFVGDGDPVGTGLVASLAKPGGNITGASISAPGLYAKRLHLLKEAVPTAKRRPDALFVADDPVLHDNRRRIVERATQTKLPALYGFREYVEAGGLISYGANNRENYRAAAEYVDRILKGARPQDLPVSQATLFELCFKLRTARAHGVILPSALLLRRADQVIE